MPKRIQRKRTRGWKKPVGAVCVDRSTKWGNPFDWRDFESTFCSEKEARAIAVSYCRKWLDGEIKIWASSRQWILDHIDELRGFDLACWCSLDQPCHADILLEIANK